MKRLRYILIFFILFIPIGCEEQYDFETLKKTGWYKTNEAWVDKSMPEAPQLKALSKLFPGYGRAIWVGQVKEAEKYGPNHITDTIQYSIYFEPAKQIHFEEKYKGIGLSLSITPDELHHFNHKVPEVGEIWALACGSNSKGQWWLHSAIELKKDLRALKYSLRNDPEYIFERNKLDLIEAVKNGNINTVKELINREQDINTRDDAGRTLLMHACSYGQEKMAEYLLSNGADFNLRDESGESALFYAIWRKHNSIAMNLIKSGAKLDVVNNSGETILKNASRYGMESIVSACIEAGVDINAKDKFGYTALVQATIGDNTPIIILLIDNGANINDADHDGRTALAWACYWGNHNIVKLLIEKGADISIADKNGVNAATLTRNILSAYENNDYDNIPRNFRSESPKQENYIKIFKLLKQK